MFAASSAFEAIRKRHANSRITLLTTRSFETLAQKMGYFDEIWLDDRAKLTHFQKMWALRRQMRAAKFQRVYDLQMVDRTNFYSYLIGPGKRPEWVGTAWGASHRYQLPKTPTYHQERLQGLLEAGGIRPLPPLNLTHLAEDIQNFPIKSPYVLFAPGASPAHRQTKCWPLERYGEVAAALLQEGLTPVIVGGADEDNRAVSEKYPSVIDLTGKTKLMDIITLATHAAFAIGNDTGPMHIASTCLCPVLALFFGKNDPKAVGPRGVFYRHLYAPHKEDLLSTTVTNVLPEFIIPFKGRVYQKP